MKCVAAGKKYFPHWEKGKGQQKVNCCVPSCNLDVHVTKHQFSWQVICAALGIASVSEGESDLPLCASHYQLVYRLCNPEKVQICKSCGTKQKCVYHESAAATAGKCFLPCPEPQREFDVHISMFAIAKWTVAMNYNSIGCIPNKTFNHIFLIL